ncbi:MULTISPECIES: hypothetical protein [Catenuloplanes]|uniref:Uncharacterized protein n=1 Tax=Catenuloplanes niger TaxID=587534 RepID=A0AAE3ZVJ6_9ACTN|nr:hypothetical protein [Catenuloplanes niger]MDR7326824.1 hypothetical protein [Catenuloplanes niger]
MTDRPYAVTGFDQLIADWIAEHKPSAIEIERVQAWVDALQKDPEPVGADQLGGHSGIIDDDFEDMYHARIDGTSVVATWQIVEWRRQVVGRLIEGLPDA